MNIRRVLESIFGCEMGQNSDDRAFGLRLVQCDGTCHLAPLVRREGRYIGPLSVSDTIRLARELKGEGEPESGPEPGGEEAGEGQPSIESADEQKGGGA